MGGISVIGFGGNGWGGVWVGGWVGVGGGFREGAGLGGWVGR